MKSVVLVIALIASVAFADVYMQYPRGMNNRLNEANRDRNTNNRVFDSQNNDRGGYNVGSTYFYVGTTINMEWTNQHSCGNPNNKCEIIIQMMCDPLLRDGTTTDRIDDTKPSDDLNPTRGRHESYAYYQNCKYRSRNKGLFTANQALQGAGAIYTRQNPNGARNGYECPEERDYYPYWSPTPWVDLAILTNEPSRCPEYLANSENVAPREYCQPPADFTAWYLTKSPNARGFIPINKTECYTLVKSPYMTDENNQTLTGQWVTSAPNGYPAPTCTQAPWSRDNHLGNVAGGYPMGVNITVPDRPNERCVMRIRYNISTGEYKGWNDGSVQANDVNRTLNSVQNPNANNDPAWIPIWSKYGLQFTDVSQNFDRTNNRNDANGANVKNSRGYVFKNNPRLDIFGNGLIPRTQNGGTADANTGAPAMVRLEMAVNTNQFGRTFQDRTHRMAIRARPDGAAWKDARIHNVQVKGRRGNIVQTYPATEYDFWPTRLEIRKNDYIHFQWTGSNNNPDGAGQGQAQTDRHNAILLRDPNYEFQAQAAAAQDMATFGDWGNNYPAKVTARSFLGLGVADMKTLAILTPTNFGGNLRELDDASPYFDLGPRQVTQNGYYHYVCTRNNNFSNRDQKGLIAVSDKNVVYGYIGTQGGVVSNDLGAKVYVPIGAFTTVTTVSVSSQAAKSTSTSFSGEAASEYILVSPLVLPLNAGFSIQLLIPYSHKPLIIPSAHRSDSLGGSWESQSATFHSDGVAELWITRGGYYVVKTEVNWGAIVGIVIGVLAVVALITYALYRKYHLKKSLDCREDCRECMDRRAAKGAAGAGASHMAAPRSPTSPSATAEQQA